LVIGRATWEDVEKMFKDMGFNRVYPPSVLPPQVITDLEADLSLRRG